MQLIVLNKLGIMPHIEHQVVCWLTDAHQPRDFTVSRRFLFLAIAMFTFRTTAHERQDKIIYMVANLATYSAMSERGNCQLGVGRCSAAKTAESASCKIQPHNSLKTRWLNFAAMEKEVKNYAFIYLYSSF